MPRSQPFRAVVLLILPLTACSVLTPAPRSSVGVATTTASRSTTDATPSTDLNDGNVMAILLAANDAQVRYAEIALAKSKDGEIRKFALMTKFDHESVSGAVRDLAKRLRIQSENSELSTTQYAHAVSIRSAFRDLEGASFDSAYIVNAVEFHRTLLRTIDDLLLPTTDEDELRTLLTAVRPAMAAHLEHAEAASRRLGR